MQGEDVREMLHAGERVYGTHVCTLGNAVAASILTRAPLDFVFLCSEHMPMDRAEISILCQFYAAKGISPIVRIPFPCPHHAAMALDAGAQGIVAPYVETVEEVQEVVGAVRYRPIKGRLLREFLSGARQPSEKTVAFLNRFNRHSYTIIGIESMPAYENLDCLIGVEGVDGVFIGPHDLSVSMEAPEEWDNPALFRTIEDIVMRCAAAGIGVGAHVNSRSFTTDQVKRLIAVGMNWILDASDVGWAVDRLQSRHEDLALPVSSSLEALPLTGVRSLRQDAAHAGCP